MALPGLDRVADVYPAWLVAWGLVAAGAVRLELRAPRVLLALVVAFLVKDLVVDIALAGVPRPRVYWAEHAPLSLWIVVVGLLGRTGRPSCAGHAGRWTLVLAAASLVLDVGTDLATPAAAYGR